MSGVAGAERVKSRRDFKKFIDSYEKIIKEFPGYLKFDISGSYNSDLEKENFGDIDIILTVNSDAPKSKIKKDLEKFLLSKPETVIMPFENKKYLGKRSYNSGELISVKYFDSELGYSVQIDNIISLSPEESKFKQYFLNMPAEKQGIVLGLVKIAALESDISFLKNKLNIVITDDLLDDQEYEFNLSSQELQLRKITYVSGTYKQKDKQIVWSSNKISDLELLLFQYNLRNSFSNLLSKSQSIVKLSRSRNRILGIFKSMISVKNGEIGTKKAETKMKAIRQMEQCFENKTVVFSFGRFQPPTLGHKKLIEKVLAISSKENTEHSIYVSKTHDRKRNPLKIEEKLEFLKKMYPDVNFVSTDNKVRTPIESLKHLNNKYKRVICVVGSDRVDSFKVLFDTYNGKEYRFDSIEVVSSGMRDPDSDTILGISGTMARHLALINDKQKFESVIDSNIMVNGKSLFETLRERMLE